MVLSREADCERKERERRRQGIPARRIGRALPVQTRVRTKRYKDAHFTYNAVNTRAAL